MAQLATQLRVVNVLGHKRLGPAIHVHVRSEGEPRTTRAPMSTDRSAHVGMRVWKRGHMVWSVLRPRGRLDSTNGQKADIMGINRRRTFTVPRYLASNRRTVSCGGHCKYDR